MNLWGSFLLKAAQGSSFIPIAVKFFYKNKKFFILLAKSNTQEGNIYLAYDLQFATIHIVGKSSQDLKHCTHSGEQENKPVGLCLLLCLSVCLLSSSFLLSHSI